MKAGSKVQLMSGGETMVIRDIIQDEARCFYYDGNSHIIIKIPLVILKVIR
jgi:hypothetical protein